MIAAVGDDSRPPSRPPLCESWARPGLRPSPPSSSRGSTAPIKRPMRRSAVEGSGFEVTQNDLLDAQVLVEVAHLSALDARTTYRFARSDDIGEYRCMCAESGLCGRDGASGTDKAKPSLPRLRSRGEIEALNEDRDLDRAVICDAVEPDLPALRRVVHRPDPLREGIVRPEAGSGR